MNFPSNRNIRGKEEEVGMMVVRAQSKRRDYLTVWLKEMDSA